MEINFDKPFLLAVGENGEQQNYNESPTDSNPTEQQAQQNPSLLNLSDTPVTSSEFLEFKSSTERQIKDLTAMTQENSSLFGVSSGNILMGAVILDFILFFVVVFCVAKISELKDKYKKLVEKFTSQRDAVGDLFDKVSKLEKKIEKMHDFNASASAERNSVNRPSLQKESSGSSYGDLLSSTQTADRLSRPLTAEDKCSDFVNDFNALSVKSGFELNEAKKEFMRKYNVRAFTCINFQERMNEPIPPPTFGSPSSGQTADLWAYEFDAGLFAVVPNVKTYTENHHSARAMGEIFRSNFAKGTYSKIRVEKPAVFKGMWNFEKQGELVLS